MFKINISSVLITKYGLHMEDHEGQVLKTWFPLGKRHGQC